MPQVAFIEGAITDRSDLDVRGLLDLIDGTATLELANGKVFTLSEVVYGHEGGITTEEGEIPIRLFGVTGEEG